MRKYNVVFTVWLIICVIIFGLLCALGFIYKNKVAKYKEYEETLVTLTKDYLKEHSKYPSKNNEISVSVNKLIKYGYITKDNIVSECSGKVIVKHNKQMEYIPQIKCKYYKSSAK